MIISVDEQIQEVLRLRDDENKTFTQIAEELNISDRTVRRRYEAGVLERTVGSLADIKLDSFPEAQPVIIKANSDYLSEQIEEIERFIPLELHGDALLSCDFHIPLHDPGLVNVLIRVAKEQNIKKLIIAGDYFDMDEFSSYPPHQPEAKHEIEKHEGNLVMKTLLRWFDEIYFFWGNHDYRLARSLGFKYSFTECMKWMLSGLTPKEMDRIKFSDLDYMYYYPDEHRKVRVCHPNTYSDIPLTVGLKLYKKYSCSIYTGHSHHCAIGVAPNGTDIVIEGGGFFDKHRTEYIQRTTPNHEWIQGFHYFKDGIPHMICPTIGNDLNYREEGN